MSRYYHRMHSGENTCSIKFLKNAYIGNGVRITGGDKTVPFENIPMKGMKIIDYNKQGFRIKHANMPKSVWVDFDQLPLTRLSIHNGVIDDEITFVENIVDHRMHLIRTLDTEYIDLIYKEKALEQKKDEIIPITAAVPGEIYIGAQCEEGNEMIFLGNFYIKDVKNDRTYSNSYWNRQEIEKYYFLKACPQRAFFAIPNNELTRKEEADIEEKYYGSADYNARWKIGSFEERERLDKLVRKEKDELSKTSSVVRYKIVEFPVTSKRIKEVILTHKTDPNFVNEEENRKVIEATIHDDTDYPQPEVNYKLVNHWWETNGAISKSKATVEDDTRKIYQTYHNTKIEDVYFEERYNK